jgi:uncharacterized membrane protein YkoI
MRKLLLAILSFLLLVPAASQAGAIKGSLIKQASVTRSEAQNIALSQVQEGKVLHTDLRKEHGKLIWFFDVSRPHTKNITAVQVDAKSGNVLSLSVHPATQQSHEKRQ